ncbi:pilus assembly protein TadG-related protein [Rhodopirellula sp.]|nr:pilus assembly protein TadG-related protein [Rhodopirellula sp.]
MGSKNANYRHGQSLILLLLFMLAAIGVMALTLDFGFVLLSRRTMQAAVNTGALEGSRNIDQDGRGEAREVIANFFDDDLDSTENLTTLGAGPEQALIQRDGNDRTQFGEGTNALGIFTNRNQYIFRPEPELNPDNEVHGDLVVGNYEGLVNQHNEMGDYQRDDFVASSEGLAFLARIRRTPQRVGVANPLDRVEGISSSGSGSPLLLGHLMPFIPTAVEGFDIRRDGVTIRATAIADQRPIVYVGSAVDDALYCAAAYGYYPDAGDFHVLASTPHHLGETVSVVAPIDQVDVPTGYLPVLFDHDGQVYVVGFLLNISAADTDSRKPNASPRLHDVRSTLNGLTSEVRDAVLARHQELAQQEDSALNHSPVLVRTIR